MNISNDWNATVLFVPICSPRLPVESAATPMPTYCKSKGF